MAREPKDRTSARRRVGALTALCLPLVAALLSACAPPETPVLPLPNAATGKQFAPFTFVQAGDPQIGGWTSIEDTKARFVQFAHIANGLQPAFVLVGGDLVNDGPHEKELAAFDDALAQFRVPVRLIPGNHDDMATYRRKYGPAHYSFTIHNCEFVCLNSNPLAGLIHKADQQREADEELAWLEETLRRCRQEGRTHVFVAMHHPPQSIPLEAARLDSLFRQYDVHVILAGHLHRTIEISYRGYTTFTVAGTGWASDNKGFGYRVFHVYADRVEQEYVRLNAAPSTAPYAESRPAAVPTPAAP